MLGNTLTFTVGGAGGTVLTLPLINQDGYSSEYFLDVGTYTYRVNIRHSKDKVKLATQGFDRHNVTVTYRLKPTEAIPLGSEQQCSFIMRNNPDVEAAHIIGVADGLALLFKESGDLANRLVNWES